MTEQNPALDVAVIIPLYNGGKYIGETLESVFSQIYLPREVVIVDDGSTDNSLDVVRRFPHVKLLRNPLKGANQARNFGFSNTQSPLVAFLDQDDIWHPQHLLFLTQIIDKYPNAPVVTSESCVFKRQEEIKFSPFIEESYYDPWLDFPFTIIKCPSEILIRRKSLEEIGGWPIKFTGISDAYSSFRLSVSHPFVRNHGCTIAYRKGHDGSYSSSLRTNSAKIYSKSIISALADVISYRANIFPEKKESYENQLQCLNSIFNIFHFSSENRLEDLNQESHFLEQYLSKESKNFAEEIMLYLIWFLEPNLSNKREIELKEKHLKNIVTNWTNRSRVYHSVFITKLVESLSIRFFLKNLKSSPWEIHRWFLLYKSLIFTSKARALMLKNIYSRS